MTTIKDLKFDDKNFNKHTEFGMSLLEKSLRENGAGRSILLDKDNNIIAGNGIIEAAGSVGMEKVKVIETTGDEIVAVKRTDISLNSEQGQQMALADNATAKANLEWDTELLQESFSEEQLGEWGVEVQNAVGEGLLDELKNAEYIEKEQYFIKKPFVLIFYDDETKSRLEEILGKEIENDTYDARDL